MSEANVRELLAAASSLKYYSIEEACDDFLQQRLNKSNCLRMLNLAFLYSLGDLTDEALHMAAQHFMELSDGFDFHQMDVDQLATLISRDDIKVRFLLIQVISDQGARCPPACLGKKYNGTPYLI